MVICEEICREKEAKIVRLKGDNQGRALYVIRRRRNVIITK